MYFVYMSIGDIRENFALIKDRKIIRNKFMELEAFYDSSAVTLEQLGIQVDDNSKTKKKSKVKSLYSHFNQIMKTKLIVAYGNKFYFDMKVYKRQQMNIYITFSFLFVILIWGAYVTYLNW